jgi:23S rRNA-intervening sequence protein
MPKLDVRNSKLGEAASAIPRIRDFTDLDVWQLARSFKNDVYRLVHEFPREEKYALGPQLRRSVISITANIAEGFGR